MKRLVLASNRVPPVKQREDTAFSAALTAALRARDCIWFGWSGRVSTEESEQVTLSKTGRLTTATIHLQQHDFDEYYNGYAHQTLWPLFHNRIDLTSYERAYFDGYHRVNELYASHLGNLLLPGDGVLVQDYHLIPLGEELRRRGHQAPIGFFLHIPFPAPQILTTLYNHRRLVRSLLAYDVVGFQTADDLQAFCDYVERELGGTVQPGQRVGVGDQSTRIGTFPFGIDAAQTEQLANSDAAARQVQRMADSLGERKLIVSADRLDYTKGLRERLNAFELLLETMPELRGQVTFMQAVIASRRPGVLEYDELRRELEIAAGHLDGRYAEIDWVPLRFFYRSISRGRMAGLLRTGDVGLMTPLRDGMNLLAKEYVATQDPANPGVLVISRFAGAARALTGALVVNPYDRLETKNAIAQGLAMPLAERQERHASLLEATRRDNAYSWMDGLVSSLSSD